MGVGLLSWKTRVAHAEILKREKNLKLEQESNLNEKWGLGLLSWKTRGVD